MALILSLGFIVDDAIVMLENVMRHIERVVVYAAVGLLGVAAFGRAGGARADTGGAPKARHE